jgi:CRP-like cAMP-binding protein
MCCETCCSHDSTCITTVPVFKGLSTEETLPLQKVTRSRHVEKGEMIFREGESAQSFFVVKEGLIKLSKMSAEGKEQIVRLLFPGDFFGLSSLLRNAKHNLYAEAAANTVICTIEKKDFLKTMENNADLAYRFLLAVNERLYEADESVGSLSLMGVENRLAKALLLFQEKMNSGNKFFTLPITKKDLASYIGTTPESISRKLVVFMSQKWILMNGQRQIQILESEQLKLLAGMN